MAPVSPPAGDDAAISAGDKASISDGDIDGRKASSSTGGKANARSGPKAGRKTGKARRRVGRPHGPERVPLTVRILAATDDRLTAAVEATGQSPQYLVDAALTAYFDALGVP
jgi:hypothetical protein